MERPGYTGWYHLLPASTRVQVAGLVEPNLKVEIEAIAVLPD
jgi:enamine deaminase RidA (YjgF/YER057c/UK114 family)